MAPKGVKRVSTSSPAGPARKKTNADPVGPKCKDVVAAINSSEALPASCKEMLTNMVQSSLTVFAAERHPYQVQAVEMLRETLATVQTQKQNAVTEAQAKVDSSDRDKAARTAAMDQAQTSVAALEQQTTTGKEAVENDKTALHTAKANLAAAQAAIDAKGAEVASMTEQKSKLEAGIKELFEPLKTAKASGHDGNKAIKTLEKVFTDAGLEAGLIDSLPETLKRDPEARGTFDGLVIKHVDAQASEYSAKAERTIKDAEQSMATLTNGKTTAEASLNSAQEKLTASSAALHTAEASLKESKAALKTAQGAVGNFEREMANAGGSLEGAKAALVSFTEGALHSFAALKDLAAPPEPEPEVVAEAPAAQEPVDAAAAVA